MAQRFWHNQDNHIEPKRSFRFKLSLGIGSTGIRDIYAKTSTRPSYEISSKEHSYLNHKFKYPGHITHNDIDISIVESIGSEQLNAVLEYVKNSGYDWMTENASDTLGTVGKRRAVLNKLQMIELDSYGNEKGVYELKNPWVKKFDLSELSYESEDLAELKLTISYDWFVFTPKDDQDGNDE